MDPVIYNDFLTRSNRNTAPALGDAFNKHKHTNTNRYFVGGGVDTPIPWQQFSENFYAFGESFDSSLPDINLNHPIVDMNPVWTTNVSNKRAFSDFNAPGQTRTKRRRFPSTRNVPPAKRRSPETYQRDYRQSKDIIFTKILMKHLKLKDPNLHALTKCVAKACIRDFIGAHQNEEDFIDNAKLNIFHERLKQIVGDKHYNEAVRIFKEYVRQERGQVSTPFHERNGISIKKSNINI